MARSVGGQAVIEGVMMRAPRAYSVAVRRPSGEIAVLRQATVPPGDRLALLKLPLLRGVVVLVDTLALGFRALNWSASQALPEEEEMGPWTTFFTFAAAIALAVLLFLLVPLWATRWMGSHWEYAAGAWGFNLVDGVLRLGVFLLYLVAISLSADIRRLYAYHGAEHMALYAYEAGEPLTVESARRHGTLHPRCGTAFLLIVMVLSVVVFAQIPHGWPMGAKALSRLVLLPLVAGISYELLKLGDRFRDNPFFRLLLYPGLLLQRLTTRPPDDAQLEVALRALTEVLAAEEGPATGSVAAVP